MGREKTEITGRYKHASFILCVHPTRFCFIPCRIEKTARYYFFIHTSLHVCMIFRKMQTKIRIDTTKRTPICQNIQPLRCAIVNVYSKKLCKKKKKIFFVPPKKKKKKKKK